MKCIVVARSNVRFGFRIGSRVVRREATNFAISRLCGDLIIMGVIMPSKVTLLRKD